MTTEGKQFRTVVGGGSYLSQSDLRLVWGVPANARVLELEITWPGNLKQKVSVERAGRYVTVVEPSN